MSETKAPRGRHAEVVALAAEGVPPRDIGKRLGMPVSTVHWHLWKARRDGELTMRFKRGFPRERGSSSVVIPRAVADLIRPAADARGLTVSALAGAIVFYAAEYGLIDAVLDDVEDHMEGRR